MTGKLQHSEADSALHSTACARIPNFGGASWDLFLEQRTGAAREGEERGGSLAAAGCALPAPQHSCERLVRLLFHGIVVL